MTTSNTGTTHHLFHSMGIPVHITIVGMNDEGAKKIVNQAAGIFDSYDTRFSRFKTTSELHKLNTASGEWMAVSLPMFQVLKKCVELADETDGAFDPSVGGILASYGYGLPENFIPPSPLPTYRDIEFNDRELSVRLKPGQVLEPAGIVKSMAIDEAGAVLSQAPGFLINAGGDIVTHGFYKDGASWNLAIQDPRNLDAIVSVVAIKNKGMATSGTYQTKGIHHGTPWHHLICMRNGNQQTNDIVSATVIADTCKEADTEASLAILLPKEEALARLELKGLPYFLISENGLITKNSAFAELEIPPQALIA